MAKKRKVESYYDKDGNRITEKEYREGKNVVAEHTGVDRSVIDSEQIDISVNPILSNFDSPPEVVVRDLLGDTPIGKQVMLHAPEPPPAAQLPTPTPTPTQKQKPVESDDDKKGLWSSLSQKTRENIGIVAFSLATGLEVFGTIKAGYDAEKEGEETASHLENVAEAEREKYRQFGQQVLNEEALEQAEDEAELSASGLNFGASQQQQGQAFQNIQDASQARADRRVQQLEAEGEAIAQLRLREARLARKAGKKSRKRGILQGLGQLAGAAAGFGFGGTGAITGQQVGAQVGSTIADITSKGG